MERHPCDAVAIAAAVRSGEISADEVAERAIARIAERDPAVRAVVHTRFDQARAEVARGLPDGPLTGVPILVKSLGAEVAGLATSAGSRLFADAGAAADSELVARYRAAGAVVLGTTSTPEFGLSASTEPVLHGATRNPWALGRSAGGSSGGSAAAVAAGMVPVAHGNDSMGSIRIPSAMCGLFGLKPGRWRVPGAPFSNGLRNPLQANHVLTTSVRDSAAFLDVGAGPGPGFPGGRAPDRPFSREPGRPVGRLRIAVCTRAADGTATDPVCAEAAQRTAQLCAELGHEVFEAAPEHDGSRTQRAAGTVMGANLAATIDERLERLGRALREDDVEAFTRVLYERAKATGAGELSAALSVLEDAERAMAAFFGEVDLWLTPTAAAPAPDIGLLDPMSPEAMYAHSAAFVAFTRICNVTGQPAMSVPAGYDGTGVPLGVQVAAAHGAEGLLLRLAAQLEQAQPWQSVAPGYR
ncbi:amidase [Saccharopolyspora sp. HNM0983]|uniref:Amidase n=1 Tax=Saccharopolyspora montiporae TaxID=2781240 RepID=A0A929B6X6_9PSEU|nr:amidase [Saccharopolyspora sp. HNM0983]